MSSWIACLSYSHFTLFEKTINEVTMLLGVHVSFSKELEASFANNYMHYHAQVKQRDLGWAWF